MSDDPPQRPRKRAIRRRLVIYVLVAAAVYLGVVLGLQRKVVFPRWTIPEPGPALPGLGVEVWTMETDAGVVEAFFAPGRGVSAESPGPMVVFAHGNAELIDDRIGELRPYVDAGVSVLLPEYRGYGRSAGSPSQRAIVADFERWLERALARPEVDADRVVYHGRSLGGGVASQLAARRPPRALVLESTFTSIASMAAGKGVLPWLVRDPFDNRSVVESLDRPILILHGTTDDVVPPSHADRLAAAAKDATRVTFDAGHNDPVTEAAWRAALGFLERHGVITAGHDEARNSNAQ